MLFRLQPHERAHHPTERPRIEGPATGHRRGDKDRKLGRGSDAEPQERSFEDDYDRLVDDVEGKRRFGASPAPGSIVVPMPLGDADQ